MVKRLISSFAVLCYLILVASGLSLRAQGIFATLTGTVTDPSGSVVAAAKVVLKDAVSGSARDTVTNSEGYYTFSSVPVGTYVLTVEATGFKTYKADDIRLGGGERRNGNVMLAVEARLQPSRSRRNRTLPSRPWTPVKSRLRWKPRNCRTSFR